MTRVVPGQPFEPVRLLALETPQDCVDQADRPGFSEQTRTLGSFVDRRVGAGFAMPELVLSPNKI